jgi:iron complex outermembrane recepter protein
MSTGLPTTSCRVAAHVASVLAFTVALLANSHPAHAQEQTTQRETPNATNDSEVTTVVVTGTSIQSADSSAYQSAPVSVATADAIQKSGAASLEGFFQTQPDFVLSGPSSYSNTGGQSGADGTTIGKTTLNLRGLGPQYTLVLLNGRRFQAEDPANIDLIPVDSIERVEVLKSGASAVYGSDAVAGVVNIITKRKVQGFDFDGYFGESGREDNQTRRFSASWGTTTDNLDLLVVAEYSNRAGITQGQRPLSANPDLSRFNSNFDYGAFSYSSLAQVILPDGTGPLVLNQQAYTCGQYSRNPADYVAINPHLFASGCDAALDVGKRSLVNAQRKGTLFASLDYKLPHDLELYADFDFGRTITHSIGNLYGADGYGDVNSPLNLSPIPASNYWNPFGQDITGVTYGFPEAGPQTDNIADSTWRLNLGLKGAIGRVHYDIGGSYYYDYANAFAGNMPVSQGLYDAENRPGAASINLFCNACNTQAQIAGVFSGTSIQDWEEAAIVNAHAYAPVFTLPAGDINIAAGAEYQKDIFILQPSQELINFAFNDFTVAPVSAGRRYESVYVEGQLPVFGNSFSFPGAASLGIDVAARYENIEQVGSRTDPTVSVRWEPWANNVALRGSYGTSFRAPSLKSVYLPESSAGGTAFINPTTGQYQDYTEITGGNRNLKPETATYTNYGIVLTPQFIPGLTLQLDRWIINQKNIVIQTDGQLVLNGVQPGNVFVGANGVTNVTSIYENAAGQHVNGTDLDLDYRFRTNAAGTFDFRLTGTYLNSFAVDDDTGAGFVQYAGNTALASSLPTVSGLPKIRSLLALNWLYGGVSATYLMHYTGSYIDPTLPGGVEVGKYVTHDVQLSLDAGKLLASSSWFAQVKLSLGVNDLTNTAVPIFYAGPLGGGAHANGYDTSIVDPVGRFFYASLHLAIP